MTSKEALENIKKYLLEKLKEDGDVLGFLIIKKSVDVLEELVERDTTTKPLEKPPKQNPTKPTHKPVPIGGKKRSKKGVRK